MLQAQIFIDKDELIGMKPLNEFIMEFLFKHEIAGATSFKGNAGFGLEHKMKKPNEIFSFDDTPLLITFIDKKEKVIEVIKEIRTHFNGGLIITNEVEKW